MIYTFIAQRCSDLPVAACCRVMGVSTSGFYAWQANPVTERDWDDAVLTNTMFDIHKMSRRSYGSPRVHAELVLGQGKRCSRKRVARLMAQAGIVGIHRRRARGCTRRDPDATPAEDLVQRNFDPSEPNRLWVMDVTEHPTAEGKVYLAVVLDAWSRRVVGWSIADHIRSELVVDAVQMALWRRRPTAGQTMAHSDHGARTVHLLGLRPTTPRRRAVGVDGDDRGLLRQQRGRELLRDPAARTAGRTPLGHSQTAGARHLRLDRDVVQPIEAALLLQDAQSRRLRSSPHRPRSCGMITTTAPSAGPGDAQATFRPMGVACPTLPFRAPVVPKHVVWPVWLSAGGATPQHLRRWAG